MGVQTFPRLALRSLCASSGQEALLRGQGRSFAASASASKARPRISLVTAPDCSLCDEVKRILQEAQTEGHDFELETLNIRDASLNGVHRLRRLYQYDIPVILLDGQEIARHRLAKSHLLNKLGNIAGQ
ncbi:unnamed protein product [Jaminaea pallidilutea]